MPHIFQVYVEVIRGYYVNVVAPDEDTTLAQVYDMGVDDVEQKGELVYCDIGEHAHIVDEFDDEEYSEEDQRCESVGG